MDYKGSCFLKERMMRCLCSKCLLESGHSLVSGYVCDRQKSLYFVSIKDLIKKNLYFHLKAKFKQDEEATSAQQCFVSTHLMLALHYNRADFGSDSNQTCK